jgi:hypothetical protein
MGKLSKAAATTGLILAFTGSIASADISTTGPKYTNTQKDTTKTNVVCINNNSVSASNSSSQTATSGNASSSSNTTNGSASSGNASNSNSSNVTVTVNGSCPKGTTAAPANSPAAKAAAAGQTNLHFDTAGNLLLPETGANDTIKLAVVVATVAAAFAAVSQLGLALYRKTLNR